MHSTHSSFSPVALSGIPFWWNLGSPFSSSMGVDWECSFCGALLRHLSFGCTSVIVVDFRRNVVKHRSQLRLLCGHMLTKSKGKQFASLSAGEFCIWIIISPEDYPVAPSLFPDYLPVPRWLRASCLIFWAEVKLLQLLTDHSCCLYLVFSDQVSCHTWTVMCSIDVL